MLGLGLGLGLAVLIDAPVVRGILVPAAGQPAAVRRRCRSGPAGRRC
jgi:hypothetical protein